MYRRGGQQATWEIFCHDEQDDLYVHKYMKNEGLLSSHCGSDPYHFISVFFAVNSELGMKHFNLVTMKNLAILLEKHAVPGYSIVQYFIALPVLCTLLKLNWFMQSSSLLDGVLCRFHGDNVRGRKARVLTLIGVLGGLVGGEGWGGGMIWTMMEA